MSDQWRILVAEDEENLNWSIVNSLRKDGYFVRGVMNGAEAIHTLQTEGYDVVISDLKMVGADGFELLQWLRMYRPQTRLIMITAFGSASTRNQALEGGVVSYLEKPFDLHTLKEELRRLLQQTGFSANLDSFDLLDVIQIITMSRKSIALLVNTGLEERGILRFQGGELIWAEYGILRGEEAFFALAAHKNGIVIHQPWNDQITPNVTQPLSRLIFQALQYRTKYAMAQQHSGEHIAAPSTPRFIEGGNVASEPLAKSRSEGPFAGILSGGQGSRENDLMGIMEEDDRPFVFAVEEGRGVSRGEINHARTEINHAPTEIHHAPTDMEENPFQIMPSTDAPSHPSAPSAQEWWQKTGWLPRVDSRAGPTPEETSVGAPLPPLSGEQGSHSDLPSWLTEQPTMNSIPALRPSSLSSSGELPIVRSQPLENPAINRGLSAWGDAAQVSRTGVMSTGVSRGVINHARTEIHHAPTERPSVSSRKTLELPATRDSREGSRLEELSRVGTSPAPTPVAGVRGAIAQTVWGTVSNAGLAGALVPPTIDRGGRGMMNHARTENDTRTDHARMEGGSYASDSMSMRRILKRNYSTLVSALQTLGYSIPGFVATAVITLDGHPIAQVAIDDLDISPLYGYLSTMLQGVFLSLEHVNWGGFEDTVINSADRRILLRLVGDDREAFHILVTTQEADSVESLKLMANVAGAMAAALQ
jgi:DNA-binding response OmpR family regulator/predicted regulator of Ras-like GTPase activity (Roadblock/LC7/MglB family)